MRTIQHNDFTNINVAEVLAELAAVDIVDIADTGDLVMQEINSPRDSTGLLLPWGQNLRKPPRLRERELVLLGGYNGHGKTTGAYQIMLECMKQGCKTGIISLELPIQDTVALMCQQAYVTETLTRDQVEEFIDAVKGKCYLYDKLDLISPADCIACLYYMITELHVKHILVDSLMMIDIENDLVQEKRFVATLAALAKKFDATIILVAHMRKPSESQGECRVPGKYDFSGGAAITNSAMTVLIWWTDKQRKYLKSQNEYVDPNESDGVLVVAKQRNGRFEGEINIWQHEGVRAYADNRKGHVSPFWEASCTG